MRRAVAAVCGVLVVGCVIACGSGGNPPASPPANQPEPAVKGPPGGSGPPVRLLDAASVAEVAAAFRADPAAAAKTYRPYRWRLSGTVSSVTGTSAVLTPPTGGEWHVEFAEGEITKVGAGQAVTVEADLAEHSADGKFQFTFRKARVVI
jgi:hypothetical protein